MELNASKNISEGANESSPRQAGVTSDILAVTTRPMRTPKGVTRLKKISCHVKFHDTAEFVFSGSSGTYFCDGNWKSLP